MEDLENKVDGITMPAEDSQVSVENSNESSNEPETISFADLAFVLENFYADYYKAELF